MFVEFTIERDGKIERRAAVPVVKGLMVRTMREARKGATRYSVNVRQVSAPFN